VSEFQPPDREEEPDDDKWERWFAQQEKNGYAAISREEWCARLDEAATDGYADGRKDEREQWAGCGITPTGLMHLAERLGSGITTGHDWPSSQEELDRLSAARVLRWLSTRLRSLAEA